MNQEPSELKRWLGSVFALPRTSRLLVAVSGGRDSVALLHRLKESGFHRLIVCHLDHRLRGRASADDARFVAALAEKLGYEVELGEADVQAEACETRRSIETAAREARYRFFAEVALRRRCPRILLAHHADDQVETLLFNLFRGAGRAGLGGMRPESERTIRLPRSRGEKQVALTVLRPMLAIWRHEIDDYIANHQLNFREDASNASLDPVRNRLRHELIPMVERLLGREVREVLWRTGEILRDEEEWLANLVPSEKEKALSTRELKQQPVAQQRRRIQAWLKNQSIPNIGYEEVERVRSLLAEGGPAKVNLPGDHHARRREKKLFIE